MRSVLLVGVGLPLAPVASPLTRSELSLVRKNWWRGTLPRHSGTQRIGKPVVTSTQAALSRLLRLASVDTLIDGFGQLNAGI